MSGFPCVEPWVGESVFLLATSFILFSKYLFYSHSIRTCWELLLGLQWRGPQIFLYTNIQVYLLLLCFQVHRNAYCCPFDVFKSFGSGGHYQIHQRASEKPLNLVFSCENGGAPCRRECITFVFEGSTNNPESV